MEGEEATLPKPPSSSIDQLYVQEYLYSAGAWDDFDSRCLTIKGWTAAGGLAAIVAGLGAKELSLPIMAAAGLVIISLWCLEAQWRVFQHSNHARILQLEDYFAGRRRLSAPFQPHTLSAEVRKVGGWRSWWRELVSPLVFVPYLPLLTLLAIIGVARVVTPAVPDHLTTLSITLTR